MKLTSVSLVITFVVTIFLPGCQKKTTSEPGETYFADIHIAPNTDPTEVWAYIVFDRVAQLDNPAGLAHYAEHLVALNSIVDDVDSPDRHANAYTSPLTVGYHIKGPREDLNGIIKKLSGVFDPLKLHPDFAQQEIGIVEREYDLGVINNVDYLAYESMSPFLYEGNAIAVSVISTPQNIRTYSYEKAKTYYDATHLRKAAVLLVQGNVTKQEVSTAVSASGLTPLNSESITKIKPEAFKLAEPESRLFEFNVASAEPRISFRKIVRLDKPIDYDLLDLQTRQLASALAANLPGGLAGELRYDNFVARSFTINLEAIDEQHVQIWFYATLDNGVSFEQLQSTFEEALKVSSEGIPASTYERIKMRTKQYWLDWEDSDAVTEWMQEHARHRVSVLRSPASEKSLKQMSEQITLEDINRLVKALQNPGRQAIAYIGKSSVDSSDSESDTNTGG